LGLDRCVSILTTPETLHYVGSDNDRGGIVAVIRAMAAAGRFRCLLGVNPGCVQYQRPPLPVVNLPAVVSEKIDLANFWRARAVAAAVQTWLREDAGRVFHGHSRAGLLVGLWLRWRGERRVVVSVHCYGRQRWFYRWSARQLGDRLFWLTPAMRRYYDAFGTGWAQCIPGGVPPDCFGVTAATPVPGRLRLGGAGMFVRWKRWDLVAEALALLPAESRAQVSFEHIGGTIDEPDSAAWAEELRQHAKTLGAAERITWRGPEPSSHRLLSEVDLLVVPSHHEPYSMILQEALAAGVPVLAAASGGPPDVVRPGENGWLFPDGDAGALAGLIDAQLRNRAWTALDRAAIRRTARPAAAAAAEWLAIYARL
jgi:glycosyltransferase involved in cell wall biosynthesis